MTRNDSNLCSQLQRLVTPEGVAAVLQLCGMWFVMWYVWKAFPQLVPILVPIGLVAYAAMMILERRRTRGLYREAAASKFRRCTRCLHDLTGLADDGVCPECGGAYALVALEHAWKHAARVPSRIEGEVYRPLSRYRSARRLPRSVVLLSLAILIVGSVSLIVRSRNGVIEPRDMLVLALSLVPLVPALLLCYLRNDLTYLVRERFRVCPRCHMPLPKRPTSGACKSCRLLWDEQWLEATWRSVYTKRDGEAAPNE